MKNIAVLTSGTDNTGINGAIRAITRFAPSIKARVIGVHFGYRGLIENDMVSLNSRSVSGVIGKSGSFLGTSHPSDVPLVENIDKVLDTLKLRNITSLVVVGGQTSIEMSNVFIKKGIQTIAIPSTIQDDIPETDIALGVDSAVNNIIRCIDFIRGCDSSRNRTFLIGVDGKIGSHLALRAATTSGAEFCFGGDLPYRSLPQIAEAIAKASLCGQKQTISIISNGSKPTIDEIEAYFQEHYTELKLHVRKTVLGYVQRGGAPSGYDRLLGTKFGAQAAKAIANGETGVMVALQGSKIVNVPYSQILNKQKPLDQDLYQTFKLTR